MATDTETAKLVRVAELASALGSNSNALTEVQRQRRFTVVALAIPAAEAMASDASDFVVYRTTGAVRLISARIIPKAALTAHDTNYATCSLEYDDDAGGSDTSIASVTTKITGGTGNWATTATEAMTLVTDPAVASGKAIHFKTAKSGSGVAVGICLVQMEFEEV